MATLNLIKTIKPIHIKQVTHNTYKRCTMYIHIRICICIHNQVTRYILPQHSKLLSNLKLMHTGALNAYCTLVCVFSLKA